MGMGARTVSVGTGAKGFGRRRAAGGGRRAAKMEG